MLRASTLMQYLKVELSMKDQAASIDDKNSETKAKMTEHQKMYMLHYTHSHRCGKVPLTEQS
jgi:hypothetical protein